MNIRDIEELKEDWWQDRYGEWCKTGMHFSQSTKPMERRQFQAWVKRIGKRAKENNNLSLMKLAYAVIKDYEIYPDEIVNTEDYF